MIVADSAPVNCLGTLASNRQDRCDSSALIAGKAFEPGTLVIARSSANVEDLEGMSGAGLYDSLPNIPADDASALGKAVAGVWASLYTRRAVLTRRAAGSFCHATPHKSWQNQAASGGILVT